MLTAESVSRLFSNFDNLRVLIVGDVMIDSYLFGTVDRISPEAPVPVVAVKERSERLGGAANVAVNIKALGSANVAVWVRKQ
jgi:bifunctional ADP-heptose synthase (sugar kinase/adenylyltransferase)